MPIIVMQSTSQQLRPRCFYCSNQQTEHYKYIGVTQEHDAQVRHCHLERKDKIYDHYYWTSGRHFVDNISNAYFLQKDCVFLLKFLLCSSLDIQSTMNNSALGQER